MRDGTAVDLSTRLALRPKEAAAALGISERALRVVAPELPKLWIGRTVLYPVKELETWLSERAKADQTSTEKAVNEILKSLNE